VLLGQRIAVILHLMVRLKFESGVFHNVAIHGNAAGANFTPGNSAAYAELLSDKLIKSHEIFLALMVLEVGQQVRKKKQSGTVQYNGLVAPLKGKSFVAYYLYPK
jgi:hypothetical protein